MLYPDTTVKNPRRNCITGLNLAKIAFILLCHKDPEAVIRQAESLTASGDCMSIHFDARATSAAFARIRKGLAHNQNVTLTARRVRCGWGEWSLVQATLNALAAARDRFSDATHFYMISESCAPIKSSAYMHDLLDARDTDYIESFDFFDSNWIRTGMKQDRLIYRHPFNERTQPRRFYAAYHLQRALGLSRDVPADIDVQIGSQWWCLRRATITALLEFTRQRRDVVRFFRTTWIPDESYFQTLVRHLVPASEIETRPLTFLMFTDYGLPVTFHNDHYDLLLGQDCLFARKISPEARDLSRRLAALFHDDAARFRISNEGRNLFTYLTRRGREGRRIAPRFWEAASTLGRDRVLMVVVCKKWHVARRLLNRIAAVTSLPTIGYLFSEQDAGLPDLGGIETSLDKRTRHRRALMRMLFDHYGTDELLICLDPTNIQLLQDFCSDRSATRILEIQCRFSDDDLVGHAIRLGLAGREASSDTLARLLPTLRGDLLQESDRLRDAGFDTHIILREIDDRTRDADLLARFLDIAPEKAQEIAQIDHLFTD
jgi:hypothetical protein